MLLCHHVYGNVYVAREELEDHASSQLGKKARVSSSSSSRLGLRAGYVHAVVCG